MDGPLGIDCLSGSSPIASNDQISKGINIGLEAGVNEGIRIHLLHHRRSIDVVTGF